MPDDLDDLTDDQLKERIRTLEASGAQGRNSPWPANPAQRLQEVREFTNDNDRRHDFESRFNSAMQVKPSSTSPAGESRAPISREEAERYVKELGGTKIAAHLARNSSSPGMRDLLNHGPLGKPETW
jgi:hypothetical protein